MEQNVYHAIVIGAGMAGLSAAGRLQERGYSVLVVDKGRGVGGRMATRRVSLEAGTAEPEEAVFDHGAQFFTVRSEAFRTRVDGWLSRGVAREWARRFPRSAEGLGTAAAEETGGHHPRYRGSPGMTGIAKLLAGDLDVRTATRIASIRRDSGALVLTTTEDEELQGRTAVLTPPVPQSIALLEARGLADGSTVINAGERGGSLPLSALQYDKCLVLLAVDPAAALPEPGGLFRPGGNIDWIADNGAKGVSSVPGSFTVHFSSDFSERLYEASDEEVYRAMLPELQAVLPMDPRFHQVKRWRYSKPRKPLEIGAVALPEAPEIILAGDAFAGARLEGAFLSGLAAAEKLEERLGAGG